MAGRLLALVLLFPTPLGLNRVRPRSSPSG